MKSSSIVCFRQEAADLRGGGHFSGRLTAPLVFAGALCNQALAQEGVRIGARLMMAGGEYDDDIAYSAQTAELLAGKDFPVYGEAAAQRMKAAISQAAAVDDSIGGIAEVFAVGVKKGLGGPLFDGAEGKIASLVFGVPGVKGVEFGAGFALAAMRGSEANDSFVIGADGVELKTNRSGGLQGGITVGASIVVRAAFRPTPSIAMEQDTVELETMEPAKVRVQGRHDPCVALRGVYAVEACLAVALLDLTMEG